MAVLLHAFPRARRRFIRLFLLAVFIILCISSFFNARTSSDQKTSKFRANAVNARPLPSNPEHRISDLDCQRGTLVCHITNLYVIDSQLHAFVGSNPKFQHPGWDSVVMVAGIGFGSSKIKIVKGVGVVDREMFDFDDYSKLPFDPDVADMVDVGELNAEDGRDTGKQTKANTNERIILLHLHRSLPPDSATLGNKQLVITPHLIMSVIWNNLFRTIYAGAGAYYTMMSQQLFFPSHFRWVLLERPNATPNQFLDNVLQAGVGHPLIKFEDLHDGVYKTLLIGLSVDINVAEISVEEVTAPTFSNKRLAFELFTRRVEENVLGRVQSVVSTETDDTTDFSTAARDKDTCKNIRLPVRPRVTLILRNTTRRIINSDTLIAKLQEQNIDLQVHYFGAETSLQTQLSIISQTDILISPHGAAMSHLLFLSKCSSVIELFPYKFRKHIYSNLALLSDMKYSYWQNRRRENAIFHWDLVEQHRFGTTPKHVIEKGPVDWYDMDSKNYWRNQDMVVDVDEVMEILNRILDDGREGAVKYLMYMPWEQFGNQIIGLKSACAVANILNRILVVPPIGHRNPYYTDPSPVFSSSEYEWRDFGRYFDLNRLNSWPCKTISLDNWAGLTRRQPLVIRYHSLGPDTTTEQQLLEWYSHVVKVPVRKLETDNVYYQLTQEQIISTHASDTSKTLALGSMFWYYDFGIQQIYPLQKYYDFMTHDMYRQMAQNMEFNAELVQCVQDTISNRRHVTLWDKNSYAAVHLRRGDYKLKCREFESNRELYHRCYPSIESVATRIKNTFPVWKFPSLYVGTSLQDGNAEIDTLQSLIPHRVIRHLDLFGSSVVSASSSTSNSNALKNDCYQNWDPVERAIADIVVMSFSKGFIGNHFSSFTRMIVERMDSNRVIEFW